MSPSHISAVMLNHFAVEFGAPVSVSARRVMPTAAIRIMNSLENRAYSDRGLPKMIIGFSLKVSTPLSRTRNAEIDRLRPENQHYAIADRQSGTSLYIQPYR